MRVLLRHWESLNGQEVIYFNFLIIQAGEFFKSFSPLFFSHAAKFAARHNHLHGALSRNFFHAIQCENNCGTS